MESSVSRDLLKRIAVENDKAAFSEFFKIYHSKLIKFALMYVLSYKDAEDVVSEVMIKLLKKRKRILQINNIEAYLYSAIKNQSLNLQKKKKRNARLLQYNIPSDILTNTYLHPHEMLLEKELRIIVLRIVEELPPQRKLVYKMIKDDNLKIKQVADLLNIAEKTVKKHLELAIKDLRNSIKMYYIENESNAKVINISNKISLMISLLAFFIML